MDLYRRRHPRAIATAPYLTLSATLALFGCASPAPPRAPSLNLPQPVRDLTAKRIGNTVELRFTTPSNSTDKLHLRGTTVSGQLCRQLPAQPCLPVGPRISVAINNTNDNNSLTTWTDVLPPSLADGPPQLLAYRVEFFSPSNRSAGPSNQAFTASGLPPFPVQNLRASGSRLGIVLQWSPAPGNVLLRREDLTKDTHPPNHKRGPTAPIVWLQPSQSKVDSTASTLDTSALPDIPYSYSAQRLTTIQLAGHTIDLRSDMSPPISVTLSQTYPLPPPQGLTAAGYSSGTPSLFAVDLIWQPINEAGLITHLAGYNVYREPVNAAGDPTGPRTRLNSLPILQPSFHDTTAASGSSYRYSVAAIDAKGNESSLSTVMLRPSAASQ